MHVVNKSLKLNDNDFDNLLSNTSQGYKALDALNLELTKHGLSFNDFFDIQPDGGIIKHKAHIEIYSKVVCNFWNKSSNY